MRKADVMKKIDNILKFGDVVFMTENDGGCKTGRLAGWLHESTSTGNLTANYSRCPICRGCVDGFVNYRYCPNCGEKLK